MYYADFLLLCYRAATGVYAFAGLILLPSTRCRQVVCKLLSPACSLGTRQHPIMCYNSLVVDTDSRVCGRSAYVLRSTLEVKDWFCSYPLGDGAIFRTKDFGSVSEVLRKFFLSTSEIFPKSLGSFSKGFQTVFQSTSEIFPKYFGNFSEH